VVKVSHARCRQCGQTRHRNVRANLCAECWKQRKPQQQREWREIKERRADRRVEEEAVAAGREICEGSGEAVLQAYRTWNGVASATGGRVYPNRRGELAECSWCKQMISVNLDGKLARHAWVAPTQAAAATPELEEEQPMAERRPYVRLSPEQRAEVIDLYLHSETPLKEIASAYGIPETAPYRYLSEAGIRWRRGDSEEPPMSERTLPPHIEAMKDVHVAPAKAQVEEAIAARPSLIPQVPAPEVETPAEGWRVRVEGTLYLRGSLDQVVAQLRRDHPLLKIRSLEAVE